MMIMRGLRRTPGNYIGGLRCEWEIGHPVICVEGTVEAGCVIIILNILRKGDFVSFLPFLSTIIVNGTGELFPVRINFVFALLEPLSFPSLQAAHLPLVLPSPCHTQ